MQIFELRKRILLADRTEPQVLLHRTALLQVSLTMLQERARDQQVVGSCRKPIIRQQRRDMRFCRGVVFASDRQRRLVHPALMTVYGGHAIVFPLG